MAAHAGWEELLASRSDMEKKGEETLSQMKEQGALYCFGRPYHVDPEIHHGIPDLIASYGFAVLTEDSVSHSGVKGAAFSCHRPVDVPFPSL